ncbi:hypothetical protein CD110_13995 [Staphylococcus casei]|uniref:restriction endonuclease subunit S n=1 Tax=Staphylococcus casei TaxID=201828 RepID=UPI000CD1421E|nr:restriction endonuclease subunit S [Staphylococcus casei]PNZ56489.1 hypothetical protein CD110_13995 [Staphylococcus casei]WJE86453.1 restriction endonuclease subunit S [Staphylococcus casei]
MTNELANVPELRFPGFSEGWVKKRFYDCVEIEGKLVDPTFDKYQSLPHIGPGNIEKNTGRILKYNLVKDENLISGKFEFDERDIIYGKIRPQLQKICVPKFKGLASADTYPIRTIPGVCEINFIYYSLFTSRFFKYSVSVSMRTGMPKINREELGNFKLYLPKIIEQEKISSFFRKLDRQIELEEQKLSLLEEQKKGYMQQIFSQKLRFKDEDGNNYVDWSIKEIKEILIPGNKEKIEDKSIYNRLTVGLHGKGVFHLEQERKTKDTRPFYQRYEGELIIGKQNFFNGSVAIIPEEFNGYICSNAIMSYKFKDNINSKYVLEFLLQNDFLRKNEFLADGTGQKELSEKNFELLTVNIPNSTKEQQKIGDFFSKLDNFIEKQSDKVELLKERKKGFLQKMFV